jgi:hypothetical protein
MPDPHPAGELLVLRRKSRMTGWLAIAWRVAAVVGLIAFLILFHWLEREGLKDTHDGHVSFLDVIYFTMISATTTGYGDIVPVTENTRMFDALVVTPIRIFFLLIFIGSAYIFVARRSWESFLMRRIQRDLRDHIVVAGHGTKNGRAVKELIVRRGAAGAGEGARLHGPQGRRDAGRDAKGGASRARTPGDHLGRPRRHLDPDLPDDPPSRPRGPDQRRDQRRGQ